MSPYEECKRWLEGLDPLAEPTHDDIHLMQGLAHNEAFGLLLRYLGSERQGYLVALSLISLSTEENRASASVLQGKIQGIERIRETLLELFPHESPTD